MDGGLAPVDGGHEEAAEPDAGVADAGNTRDAKPIQCVESNGSQDLWAIDPTPVSLPQDEGRLVHCYHTSSASQFAAGVQASPYILAGLTAQNGYHQYVIQYVSASPPGTLRHVTALAYVPDTNAAQIPLVAIQHATNGIGPACGPTHDNYFADYMALPLVVQGFAVVATDYPGMGVDDGVSPYAVGWSEGTSVLDAVRAAAQLHDGQRFDASQLSRQLVLMGHSQGGQATLFAHDLYTQSIGFDLLGSVVFAPAYGDLRGQEGYFSAPSNPTVSNTFLFVMDLFASEAYAGSPHLADWLTPAAAIELPQVLHDHCLFLAQQQIENDFPTVADLMPLAFSNAIGACAFDGGACAGFSPFTQELAASIPGDVHSRAPILILQGESDSDVLPETTACIKQRLDLNGTPATACGYAGLDHYTIMAGAIGDGVSWVQARLDGGLPMVCPAPLAETCLPDGPNSPPPL